MGWKLVIRDSRMGFSSHEGSLDPQRASDQTLYASSDQLLPQGDLSPTMFGAFYDMNQAWIWDESF
jgi:hypothetical protein